METHPCKDMQRQVSMFAGVSCETCFMEVRASGMHGDGVIGS